jgi:hypothetical protein
MHRRYGTCQVEISTVNSAQLLGPDPLDRLPITCLNRASAWRMVPVIAASRSRSRPTASKQSIRRVELGLP